MIKSKKMKPKLKYNKEIMKRIAILILFLTLFSQKIFAYYEGSKVYVCLTGGKGSCKAIVKRIGKDTVKVEWLETCKTINSFLGFGDFREGEEKWILKDAIKSYASSCE